jgi:hypothetical protein
MTPKPKPRLPFHPKFETHAERLDYFKALVALFDEDDPVLDAVTILLERALIRKLPGEPTLTDDEYIYKPGETSKPSRATKAADLPPAPGSR